MTMHLILLKRLLVLAIWVVIWILIVPLAKRKGVSSFKWYFGAIGAFYGPFLAMTFGPVFLSLILEKPKDRATYRAIVDNIALLASVGLAVGASCLFLVRRKLKKLPDSRIS